MALDSSCSPVTTKQAEVAPSARTSDKAVHFSSWNAKSLALLGSHQSQTLPSQALPERESSFQPSKQRSPSFLPRLCGPTQGGNEAKPDKCPFRLVWLHLCDLPVPFQPLCGTVLGGCSCTTTTRHVSQQLVNESSCFEYFTHPSGYKSQTFTCSLLEIKVTRWHGLPLTALCFFLRAFCFQLSLDKGSGAEPQDSEARLKQSEEPSVALSCSAAARADNHPCSGLAPSRGLSSLTLNGLSGRDSAQILSHTVSASASEHPFWLHPQF